MTSRPGPGCLLLGAALLASACSDRAAAPPDRPLTVAAAASLRPVLEPLLATFQARHTDLPARISFGSSGQFFAQLRQGAPFDLFLSADADYPQQLIAGDLAAERFVFAHGRLVLWVPDGSPVDLSNGLRGLAAAGVRRIAIASPELAPYGAAALAALQQAGILEQVRQQLVFGENVAQAAAFASSGAADAGLIARSLALTPALQTRGHHWLVPQGLHPPIVHEGVVLHGARAPAAARAFRDLLLGPEGRAELAIHGFDPPD